LSWLEKLLVNAVETVIDTVGDKDGDAPANAPARQPAPPGSAPARAPMRQPTPTRSAPASAAPASPAPAKPGRVPASDDIPYEGAQHKTEPDENGKIVLRHPGEWTYLDPAQAEAAEEYEKRKSAENAFDAMFKK